MKTKLDCLTKSVSWQKFINKNNFLLYKKKKLNLIFLVVNG